MVRMKKAKGQLWLGYVTSISRKASKRLVTQIMKWKIHRATGAELVDIANQKARVIRGWINYYGRFRLYCMQQGIPSIEC